MENNKLAMELQNHVKELGKKDSALNNAVFWELVYNGVSESVEDDLTKMFVLNKYMMDINLGGLRVIRDSKKINNEGDYYTITGAQFIISVKVPELTVSGLVHKNSVRYDDVNGVAFTDRINIVEKFCESKGLSEKQTKDFTAYLIKELKVEDAIALILSDEAMDAAKDYILRHKICFQAKWNGLEAVKALLN